MRKILRATYIGLALFACTTFWKGSDILALAGDKTSSAGHNEVLKYRQGEGILPFEEVLAIVKDRIKGEIIEAEFEIEDGIPVYEFKYIDESGHVLEVYTDARTGVVIKEERD